MVPVDERTDAVPLYFSRSVRLGPVRLHLSRSGISWSVGIGRWSWNSRTRTQRVDLPGPFSWRSRRRR